MYLGLLAAFAGFGAAWGIWAVGLPELSQELAPSPGALGIALSAGVVGSLPAMVAGGRLVDRLGPRRVGEGSAIAYGLGFAALGATGSFTVLVAILFVAFATSGIYDVAINAAAIDFEQRSGKRVLPVLHAAFSAGGAVGAALSGLALAAETPYRWLYPVAGAVFLAAALAWSGGRGVAHVPIAGSSAEQSLFRSPVLLALGLATAMAFFAEGTMESWSAIYLRRSLSLSLLLGSAGPALFQAAMSAGRLAAGGAASRFGRRAVLISAGVFVAFGMGLALATEAGGLVLVGFAIVGLALAAVAPVAISLAGEQSPGRAGQASAVITTIGYVGFLVGPAIIGGIAQLSSLRLALSTIVLAGLVIAALGAANRQPGPTTASG